MGSTRITPTDDEMECAFQKDFLEKLISWNEKVSTSLEAKRSLEEFTTDNDKITALKNQIELVSKHTTVLQGLFDKLNTNQNTLLTKGELSTLGNTVNESAESTLKFVKEMNSPLYVQGYIEKNDPLCRVIDPGVVNGANGIDLLVVRDSIIRDYKERNTHPLRTEALRFLHHELLGENGEVKKSALMKAIITTENIASGNSKRALTFLKSHFSTSRHHPEIRVIKLLSQFKEGANSPAVAKHNAELLEKIHKICDSVTNDAKCKSSETAKKILSVIQDYISDVQKIKPPDDTRSKLEEKHHAMKSRISEILTLKTETPSNGRNPTFS